MKNFSLYIHIPFCKQKCAYCDFTSFDHCEENIDDYVGALINEISLVAKETKKDQIYSIFLGGGTPSLLEPVHITRLFSCIKNNFSIMEEAEITIECNPGTLTKEKILTYQQVGINRISLGLQSTHEKHLKNLGRIHSYDEFLANYYLLRDVGFNNINVDLMFALPNQSLEEWLETVDGIIALKPEHISKYSLSIEKGTKFYKKYEDISNVIDEELERQMYDAANERLVAAGYSHYEISNYSLKGYECGHNNVYWTLEPYIGVGVSAASYFDYKRYENTKHMKDYIEYNGVTEKIREAIHETSEKERMEEFMFLGLRLLEGISKKRFLQVFNKSFEEVYYKQHNELKEKELIMDQGDKVALTRQGVNISNYVLSEFLLED